MPPQAVESGIDSRRGRSYGRRERRDACPVHRSPRAPNPREIPDHAGQGPAGSSLRPGSGDRLNTPVQWLGAACVAHAVAIGTAWWHVSGGLLLSGQPGGPAVALGRLAGLLVSSAVLLQLVLVSRLPVIEPSLIWDDRSSLAAPRSVPSRDFGAEKAAVEVADATVDHSDIRGSSSGLAVMVVIRRELPQTRLVGQGLALPHRDIEGPPFPCAPRPTLALLQQLHALRFS
jgi:hypothetical protein